MKTAVFPGSFDPITLGHVDIIRRSVDLFDRFIVAIGTNSRKKYYFPLETRMKWINELFADDDRIEVMQYRGLTVDFCLEQKAHYLVRGVRSAADFEYEKVIAQVNTDVANGRGDGHRIETILMLSRPEYSHISSTVVKEIILGEGNYEPFVPEVVRIQR